MSHSPTMKVPDVQFVSPKKFLCSVLELCRVGSVSNRTLLLHKRDP